MRKCIVICLLLALCLALPLQVSASELDTQRLCTLALDYSHDGVAFPNLEIAIYRVAEAFPDGRFELIAPYNSFPVNIHGITSQREWQDVATTLIAYITAEQVAPSHSAVTDGYGIAFWDALPSGLYLVRGVVAQNENGTYLFNDFMIYLPTPTDNGNFCYDMQAKPKCTSFTPATAYQVVKLWKDLGLEDQRPVTITVDIYKDGQLHETVVLSEENEWRYGWTDQDGAKWHVVEQDAPEGYQVSISAHETVFTITNTNPDDPPPPPDTGDEFPVLLAAVLLVLVGFAMILLSLRGTKYEKKA